MSDDRIDVLFVCVHNAGRSVAAKILFNDSATRLGLNLRSESAGKMPSEKINQSVKRILESFNLDTANEVPKALTDLMLASEPRIVTLGCNVDSDACPAINFSEVDDWDLSDPSEMVDEEEIVSLIHEIARRVNTLIREMSTVSARLGY